MAVIPPPSPNSCNSNLIIPLPQALLNPCVGDLGGFVTEVFEDGTGLYYDIGTGTIRNFTNPLGLDIEIASRICLDPFSTEAVQSVDNTYIYTLQFFIDSIPVTAVTPINAQMTAEILELFIGFGITDPNVTITVNSFNALTGLDVTVTLSTTTAVTGSTVVIDPAVGGESTYSSTFACNVPPVVTTRRTNKKKGAIIPSLDVAFLPAEIVPPVIDYGGFTFVLPTLIFEGTLQQLGNHPYLVSNGVKVSMQDFGVNFFIPQQVNKTESEWINTMPTKVYRYTNTLLLTDHQRGILNYRYNR